MSDVHVTGLSDLQKFLDELPLKMEKNIMRGALRAGINPIRETAKENVGVVSGLLRAGIKVSTKIKGQTIYATLKTSGKHGYVARWVEFGTAAHRILANKMKALKIGGMMIDSVAHPGAKPHPFMRPALDARMNDAVLAVGNYVKNRLATKEGLDTSDILIGIDE